MGGVGSGGVRVGSGRKPKSPEERALTGGKRAPRAGTTDTPIEAVVPPEDLAADELAEWKRLAPLALAARTLTSATAGALVDLCAAIVMARKLWTAIHEGGLQVVDVTIDARGAEHRRIKANPLLTHHRGMLQRVEAGRARFRLAPSGKELTPVTAPDDPWAEFDEGDEAVRRHRD